VLNGNQVNSYKYQPVPKDFTSKEELLTFLKYALTDLKNDAGLQLKETNLELTKINDIFYYTTENISKITGFRWENPNAKNKEEQVIHLEVKTIKEIEELDKNWREKIGTPKYVVLDDAFYLKFSEDIKERLVTEVEDDLIPDIPNGATIFRLYPAPVNNVSLDFEQGNSVDIPLPEEEVLLLSPDILDAKNGSLTFLYSGKSYKYFKIEVSINPSFDNIVYSDEIILSTLEELKSYSIPGNKFQFANVPSLFVRITDANGDVYLSKEIGLENTIKSMSFRLVGTYPLTTAPYDRKSHYYYKNKVYELFYNRPHALDLFVWDTQGNLIHTYEVIPSDDPMHDKINHATLNIENDIIYINVITKNASGSYYDNLQIYYYEYDLNFNLLNSDVKTASTLTNTSGLFGSHSGEYYIRDAYIKDGHLYMYMALWDTWSSPYKYYINLKKTGAIVNGYQIIDLFEDYELVDKNENLIQNSLIYGDSEVYNGSSEEDFRLTLKSDVLSSITFGHIYNSIVLHNGSYLDTENYKLYLMTYEVKLRQTILRVYDI